MKKRLLTLILIFTMILTSIFGAFGCNKVEFKVHFIVDGTVYAILNTNGKEVIEMPENPTKEEYTFDGWYWDKDTWQTPFTINSLLDTPLSNDMKVYCKWKSNIVNVESISLDKTELVLHQNDVINLTATVFPETATDKSVSWSSSNSKVAIVTNGKITAIGYGTAIITATTTDGKKKATCEVNVFEIGYETADIHFTVGETTNVSVPAGETVYCAIDAASGSYVLEWDSPYAKITAQDKTYTTENKVELKNITEETVIAVTTTDGGRATIAITCTVWQPPMLSIGENADTEIGAGEKAIYRFAAPHAGIYTFKTESAAVSAFAISSDKAFANPTPLTAAGALTIEVQAGAEIQIELEQKGTSSQIIPITVTDETNAQTAEIVDSTAIVSAPASGRAYYILPLGQDSYITWQQTNLALTIAGKEYSGAQNEPILVKYDARNTLYIVARSIDGNAIENAVLTLQTATTSTKLTAGENSFVVPKNKSAICTFIAPENGTYTFSYAGSTGVSEIDFTSGVNFPIVLAMTTDENAQTLTATVVKGAELILGVVAERNIAAGVVINVTHAALQTETIDQATTLNLTLADKELKLYEVTASGWYKVDYITDLTEDLWQFSCAVNHSQIKDGETGYVTAGDLLLIKTAFAFDSKITNVTATITLEADNTISGTTSSVLTVGENNVIVRGEIKECTFTATESGTYRISTSDTNAKIIYKLGATNADNECVTGADDGIATSVEIELKAGETYTVYIEMLQTTIDDNNDETVDPMIHLAVLSFTIEKIA